MKFKNTNNGHIETCSIPFLWCLLFGSLYFLVKGIWSHAIISLVLAIFTFGITWLLYPFFASGIVRSHYLSKGWEAIK